MFEGIAAIKRVAPLLGVSPLYEHAFVVVCCTMCTKISLRFFTLFHICQRRERMALDHLSDLPQSPWRHALLDVSGFDGWVLQLHLNLSNFVKFNSFFRV